jgi:prophage antirepressor-like protein
MASQENSSDGINNGFLYKNVLIRCRQEDGLISISDIWKAEGKPRKGRPDEWIKSRLVQEQLKAIAEDIAATVKYYPNGAIACVEGFLEIVRGGIDVVQGVLGNPDFAIGYAKFLSEECGQWVEQKLLTSKSETISSTGFPDVFEGKRVRFVGTLDKPEWIAQDVCDVLENGLASSALRDFDEDEKGMYTIHIVESSGRKRVQGVLTVTEPGLYRLIFNSRKPIAKRFKRWIWHDVIPSLRKTGTYSLFKSNLDLEQQIELWRDRFRSRLKLKDKRRVQLVDAALVYIRANALNPVKVLSEMHDAINERFQGVKAKEIRNRNGFSKRVLLRDYYEKDPLDEISAINRLGANKIKRYNMHPVEAIHKACDDFFADDHIPQLFLRAENVHVQGRRLAKALKSKHPGEQLSLDLWQ